MTGQLEADDFDEADSVGLNLDGPDSVKRSISFETAAAEEARTNKRKYSCVVCGWKHGTRRSTAIETRQPWWKDRMQSWKPAKRHNYTRDVEIERVDCQMEHVIISGEVVLDYGQSPEEGFAAGNSHLLGAGVGRLSFWKENENSAAERNKHFLISKGRSKELPGIVFLSYQDCQGLYYTSPWKFPIKVQVIRNIRPTGPARRLATRWVRERPCKQINSQRKLQLNTKSFLRWRHICHESFWCWWESIPGSLAWDARHLEIQRI